MTREKRLEKALRNVYGQLQAEHAAVLHLTGALERVGGCEVCAALKEAQDAWESAPAPSPSGPPAKGNVP